MRKKAGFYVWIILISGLLTLSLLVLVWMKYFHNEALFFDDNSAFQQQILGLLPEEQMDRGDIPAQAASIVAENLEIPWEIVFLSDGDLLISQRAGDLVRINSSGRTEIPVPGVYHFGEGGLLGAVLHPDFEQNNQLYLYFTTQTSQGPRNKVERYRFDLNENQLSEPVEIVGNIPAAAIHNGGRIAFGSDGFLYVATGDAGIPQLAQDRESLAGKILRVWDDGSVPADNPFGNLVFSLGHRNPQGIVWDGEGRLWSTEHGPSGLGSGFDEVNLVEKGKNYGWPVIQGMEASPGMESPIIESGSQDTWAPGGIEVLLDKVLFVGLRGQAVYSVEINDGNLENFERHFQRQFGRMRAIKLGADGFVYVATSNLDGRGNPMAGDDKILRIGQEFFE